MTGVARALTSKEIVSLPDHVERHTLGQRGELRRLAILIEIGSIFLVASGTRHAFLGGQHDRRAPQASQDQCSPSRADHDPPPRLLWSVLTAEALRAPAGSAKTRSSSLRGALIWKLPPAGTATYCLPSMAYVIGGPFTPPFAWYCHTCFPDLASNARNCRSLVPVNTSPPAVATAPPIIGSFTFFCQAIFPVFTSTAENRPYCGSPVPTKAPPSQIAGGWNGSVRTL